jgi:hypothetical protein
MERGAPQIYFYPNLSPSVLASDYNFSTRVTRFSTRCYYFLPFFLNLNISPRGAFMNASDAL